MELAAQTVRRVSGFLILLYCTFLPHKFYNISVYWLCVTEKLGNIIKKNATYLTSHNLVYKNSGLSLTSMLNIGMS